MFFVCLAMCETEEEKTKFAAVYEGYKQLIYFIARGFVHNEQDVEDIIQECALKIFLNLKTINVVMCSETRNLIVIIVRCICLDFLRKKGRTVDAVDIDELADQHEPEALKSETPIEMLINKDSYELLLEKAELLSEIQKAVVVLKCDSGYSTREAAEILGITVKEAGMHFYRAKKRLRKLITDEMGVTV